MIMIMADAITQPSTMDAEARVPSDTPASDSSLCIGFICVCVLSGKFKKKHKQKEDVESSSCLCRELSRENAVALLAILTDDWE